MNKKHLLQISQVLHERILELETQKLAQEKSETLFQPEETENLHGEFEKDVEKYRAKPKLFDLLTRFKEIFGPLPPPSAACPLVQMDLQLKDEWVG